jgi:hypothetical protein
MAEAFPWSTAPTYLVRYYDRAYGQAFQRTATGISNTRLGAIPWFIGAAPARDVGLGSSIRGANWALSKA